MSPPCHKQSAVRWLPNHSGTTHTSMGACLESAAASRKAHAGTASLRLSMAMGCRIASDKCLSNERMAVGDFLTSGKAGICLGQKGLTSHALPGCLVCKSATRNTSHTHAAPSELASFRKANATYKPEASRCSEACALHGQMLCEDTDIRNDPSSDATMNVCTERLWMASSVSKAIPPASSDLEIPNTPPTHAQPTHPTDFLLPAFKGVDAPQTAQFCP